MTARARAAAHAVHAAKIGVAKRAGIHYTQQATSRWSGIHEHFHDPNQPPAADCSSYTTWLMWDARIAARKAPGEDIVNGEQWKAGYTGTQTSHGHRHRLGVNFWNPGRTLVFYGDGSEVEHVAIYVGNGLVVSHGSEAGPLLLPYNYRRIIQARSYGL